MKAEPAVSCGGMRLVLLLLLTLIANAMPFVADVYVERSGPFRFRVDTGAASSAVSERVARIAGLRAKFRVEQVTAAGSRLTPATHAQLSVGTTQPENVEVLIGGFISNVDGVLGQSFLQKFDYLLEHHGICLNPPPPQGTRLMLTESEGRPTVRIGIDGTEQQAVLDSGTNALVAFGEPAQGEARLVFTNVGTVRGVAGRARVTIGGATWLLPAVALPGQRGSPVLLPLSTFRAVYVNNRQRYAVLR